MKLLSPNIKTLKFTLTVALTALMLTCYSQVEEVSVEDLKMNFYEKDSSAGAAILFDIGAAYLDRHFDEFTFKYTRHTRIKFFDESELEWANVVIPYYFKKFDDREDVYLTKAITYNLVDGKIEKTFFDKKDIIEETTTNYYKQLKYAFSNVKAGSIIEFEYELYSPYKYQPRTWYFQYSIPVLYSKYTAELTSYWHYENLLKSFDTPIIDTTYVVKGAGQFEAFNDKGIYVKYEYDKVISEIAFRNIPAFYYEEDMKCKEDYISKLEFQLIRYIIPGLGDKNILKTWDEVAIDLVDKFNLNKKVKTPEALEARLTGQNLSSEEKTKIILRYVQNEFSWNGINSIYPKQESKEIQESKIGSSADINLHLIRLLKQNGVNAYPLILSTSSNGRLQYDMPFIGQFNYVLPVIADEKGIFFCDATLKAAPYYLIPSKCLNGHGFLVDKEQYQFIEMMDISQTNSDYNINCTFNSSMDSVTINVRLKAFGYDALTLRDYLLDNDKDKIAKELFPTEEDVIVEYSGDVKAEDYNKPLLINFTIKKEVMLRNGKVYINPFICGNYSENPFHSTERKYPIDYRYKRKKRIIVSVVLPNGYELESVPDAAIFSVDNNAVAYQFNAMSNGTVVQAISNFNIANPAINADAYLELQALFDIMIKSQNEYFVLSKHN